MGTYISFSSEKYHKMCLKTTTDISRILMTIMNIGVNNRNMQYHGNNKHQKNAVLL